MIGSRVVVTATLMLVTGCCMAGTSPAISSPDGGPARGIAPEPRLVPAVPAGDLSRVVRGDPSLFPEAWRVRDVGTAGVHDWTDDDDSSGMLAAASVTGGAAPTEIHERLIELPADPSQQWVASFYVFENGEQASTFADARRTSDETAAEGRAALTTGSYLVIDRVAIVVSSARGEELARRLESQGFVLARESYGSGISPPID